MKSSQAAKVDSHDSVGLGTDFRMESRKLTGFALALDDQILHLCVFARDNAGDKHVSGSMIERFLFVVLSTAKGKTVISAFSVDSVT